MTSRHDEAGLHLQMEHAQRLRHNGNEREELLWWKFGWGNSGSAFFFRAREASFSGGGVGGEEQPPRKLDFCRQAQR